MTRNATTILFASLIAVAVFSVIQTVEANQDKNDLDNLTAYEQWVLTNVLDGQTDTEKAQNIEKLRTFVATLTGYEAFIFDKVNDIAEAEQQLNIAQEQDKPDEIVQELETKLMTSYFELEEYGVTTKDRFDANPKYWKDRVIAAKSEMEKPQTSNASADGDDSTLHHVHQTDLALKRTSILTVPVFGVGPATIPFPVVTHGWNQGTSTSSWGFITAIHGKITYESIVCLDSDTHHDSVDFEMNSSGNTKNALGQVQFNFDRDFDVNHEDAGDCKTYTRSTVVPGTYSASLSTTISDISLN